MDGGRNSRFCTYSSSHEFHLTTCMCMYIRARARRDASRSYWSRSRRGFRPGAESCTLLAVPPRIRSHIGAELEVACTPRGPCRGRGTWWFSRDPIGCKGTKHPLPLRPCLRCDRSKLARSLRRRAQAKESTEPYTRLQIAKQQDGNWGGGCMNEDATELSVELTRCSPRSDTHRGTVCLAINNPSSFPEPEGLAWQGTLPSS
jgi:hypothetical protein